MRIIVIFIIFIFCKEVISYEIGSVTNLKIPRMVSLKSNDVNLRVGPSINYPIKITFIKENYPVEITDEYDVWRKIIDFKNNEGWVHKSLIRGERYAIITSEDDLENFIYNFPNIIKIGSIDNNNIVKINRCSAYWCEIKINNTTGWIKKTKMWGVYDKEIVNINFTYNILNYYWKTIVKLNIIDTK